MYSIENYLVNTSKNQKVVFVLHYKLHRLCIYKAFNALINDYVVLHFEIWY